MSSPPILPLKSFRRTPTILLVESGATERSITYRMVRGLGYDVRDAGDGREALRLVAQHPGLVQLVLADVVLPFMDGGELAERVRDREPGIRVVLMAEQPRGGVADLLGAYPELPLLRKPFTLGELYDLLSTLVGPPPDGPTLPRSMRERIRRPENATPADPGRRAE
jgi:CheY-like chemotaxis protein